MSKDPFDGIDAPAFNIAEAVREAVPALIALWGASDSGKTYSALRLARGLVGPKGKIALIDTENRRAKLYAGLFGGWMHLDLQPPFTPQRYSAAYDAAIKAGANVIVVDSQSHVWQGEGGVLDQAEANNAKGLAKWRAPKMAYMKMTNSLFRSPIHMIFCLRAKEKFVQRGSGKDAEIVSIGDVPICDSRFIFEMTVSAHMEAGTRKPLAPVKAPEPIAGVIKPGEFITEEMGKRIAEWLAGGAAVDHEMKALETSARGVATQGTVAVRDFWQALTRDQRSSLKSIIAELKDIAEQADREMAEGKSTIDDPLLDSFSKGQQAA